MNHFLSISLIIVTLLPFLQQTSAETSKISFKPPAGCNQAALIVTLSEVCTKAYSTDNEDADSDFEETKDEAEETKVHKHSRHSHRTHKSNRERSPEARSIVIPFNPDLKLPTLKLEAGVSGLPLKPAQDSPVKTAPIELPAAAAAVGGAPNLTPGSDTVLPGAPASLSPDLDPKRMKFGKKPVNQLKVSQALFNECCVNPDGCDYDDFYSACWD